MPNHRSIGNQGCLNHNPRWYNEVTMEVEFLQRKKEKFLKKFLKPFLSEKTCVKHSHLF